MNIYVVSFKKHPDLVKIGFSKIPKQRLTQLARTHGKRIKTQVYRGTLAKHAERILHNKLKAWNVPVEGDGGTEFFKNTFCKETFKSVIDMCELTLDRGFSETCPLIKHLRAKKTEDIVKVLSVCEVKKDVVRFKGSFNKQKLSKALLDFTDKLSVVLEKTCVTAKPASVYSNNRSDRERLELTFAGSTSEVFGGLPMIYDINVGGDASNLGIWMGGSQHYEQDKIVEDNWSILRQDVFSNNIDGIVKKVDRETKDILLKYKNTVNGLLCRFNGYDKPVYGVKFKQLPYGTKFVHVLNID